MFLLFDLCRLLLDEEDDSLDEDDLLDTDSSSDEESLPEDELDDVLCNDELPEDDVDNGPL